MNRRIGAKPLNTSPKMCNIIAETGRTEAGYFDQPHLTRSLNAFVGATPIEIGRGTHQLSFLYNTPPPPPLYDAHGRSVHDGIESSRSPS
jgi:hypothetical protein